MEVLRILIPSEGKALKHKETNEIIEGTVALGKEELEENFEEIDIKELEKSDIKED